MARFGSQSRLFVGEESHGSWFCNHLYRLARSQPGENVLHEHSGQAVLIVQRHEDADHILRQHVDNYPKNMRWFRQVLGESRLTEEGGAWQYRRDLTQPFFKQFDVTRTVDTCLRQGAWAADRMLETAKTGRLDESVIYRCFLAVLWDVLLGCDLGELNLSQDSVTRLVELASRHAFLAPGGDPEGYDKQTLHEILSRRRQVWQALQGLRAMSTPRHPLLEVLMHAENDAEANFRFEKEVLMLVGAGVDTPSCAMSWCLHLLAEHPDWQDVLWSSLSSLDLKAPTDALAQEVMRNADLNAFIAEALRQFPPLPFVTRIARETDAISDRLVQAGEVVIVSLIGLNAALEPVFPRDGQPNHSGNSSKSLRHSFLWGPRVCAGRNLALLELSVLLSVLIKRLRFVSLSEGPVSVDWAGQMRRAGGFPIRAVSRLDESLQ